ncbi:MAG TPA: DUF2062 domain-containing protein, partial [Sphingomonas sp.]|nr:DUF2062 domain-containing protein [Sphingomonas sp.]
LTTFFTNPFTTPFLFLLYYKVGLWALHLSGTSPAEAKTAVADGSWLHWAAADVGLPTLSGMAICAVAGAVIGYFVTALAWRLWVLRKWRKRSDERSARPIDAA